jgi:hypothetical protein
MINQTIARNLSMTVRNQLKVSKNKQIQTIQSSRMAPTGPLRDFHAQALRMEQTLVAKSTQSAQSAKFPFFRNKVVSM